MRWNLILAAGAGGFAGSALRYAVSSGTQSWLGNYPIGTLLVNIVGGFLMGFLMEASVSLWPMPETVRVLLTTGVLGGLTTFSAFSYETVSYFSEGDFAFGALHAALNLFLALAACQGGRLLAQAV